MQLRESLNLLLEQKGRGKERRMRHAEETTEIQIRKRNLLEHHVTPTTTSSCDSLQETSLSLFTHQLVDMKEEAEGVPRTDLLTNSCQVCKRVPHYGLRIRRLPRKRRLVQDK